jgi:hypothetical protein
MKTMSTDGHCRGSERSNNIRRKDSKENGMRKRMSQEEYGKEMDELNERLIFMPMLLHKKVKENQRQGWRVKKVKWLVM